MSDESQVWQKERTKELAMIGISSIPSTAPKGPNRVVLARECGATELTYQDSGLSGKCDGQRSPDSCISDPPTV
jgi:hypothetical protein